MSSIFLSLFCCAEKRVCSSLLWMAQPAWRDRGTDSANFNGSDTTEI